MKIDCNDCTMQHSHHCDDCLVTALMHPPELPVDIDEEMQAPLRALQGAGLIPVLRFRPRAQEEGQGPEQARAG